jgi:ABC-2 type transport system ATP-binding protein
MRVDDWLRFSARFYPSWSGAEQTRLCGLLELDSRAKVKELSKGNRAKLGLVAALAHAPELLLLDEAFSGLDAATRQRFAAVLIEHLREEGRSVLLVSHSTSDIERVCDRVAILKNGRIVKHEDIETLARSPRGGLDLDAALRRETLPLEACA